ncbi:ABC transporter ATP-binding protein [Jiangella asiatica]|uniref:ABC-type quaternary amine transporter n=1 Tax=Jiangella asiatica TaxID=2530372 RepID=A0A4R5DR27_9ACTN|nr:ABC transporter ATP-binding protein [Jiangella asiatica]TDE13485.1 ABC transporter ATP-binding protein [Jiangella asiatica]
MHVNVDNVSVQYGDNVAVRGLSLEIASGEMVVLLGPSGCGKTSTMRSIVGLETPSSGTITIGDRVMFDKAKHIDVPANRRNVGMVFQSYAIWPHMTVAQNVGFPLRMRKVPKAESARRVADALELVGLADFGSRGASLLSGGQMQRVALARALVMRPDVLLFDEPLSNLDAKLREQLRDEIRDVQQRAGLTAVYVTHDQGEALALADRVAVMRDGVIVQLDTPERLYEAPRNSFVADFLGMSNIFHGRAAAPAPDGTQSISLDDRRPDVIAKAAAPLSGSVSLCVRPERLRLHRRRPDVAHPNVWSGTVTSLGFFGTHTRYRVRAAGMDLDVVTFAPGADLRRGDQVHVAVEPCDVEVLPEVGTVAAETEPA